MAADKPIKGAGSKQKVKIKPYYLVVALLGRLGDGRDYKALKQKYFFHYNFTHMALPVGFTAFRVLSRAGRVDTGHRANRRCDEKPRPPPLPLY